MKKPIKLSKGFWHKFIPNSDRLISPQNIKFEIWDLTIHKIIEKWHPEIFCIRNCAFNKSGTKFILSGGCNGNESKFKIYNTNNFELINEFWLPEQSHNAVFNTEEDTFVFGTWEGNLYKVNINDKIVLTETITKIDKKTFKEYKVSDENNNKLLSIENSMITLTETDFEDNVFVVVTPKSLGEITDLHLLSDYILIHNLKTKTTREIKLPVEQERYRITGIKCHNNKLAILKTRYGGEENNSSFNNAELYIFDLEKNILQLLKKNFKVRDVYSNNQCLSWNSEDKLSFITLDKVVIIDTLKNYEETTILADKPTSVEYSENGKLLAIGGTTKAILQSMD